MITSIYAAVLGLMLIRLSMYVIKGRRKFGAGLGDADQLEMQRRIRAHANLIEYSPLFLILLGYAEYNGLSGWAVNLIGITFVAGRCMHAYSLLKAEQYDHGKLTSKPIWRSRGMKATLAMIGLLSLTLLVQAAISFMRS